MSQRYGGPGRRGPGRPQYHQYRSSPKGPPREQHHVYRPPHERGPQAQQREGVYGNPHLAHSLTSLLGSLVEVKLTSGIVYEGILSAVSPKLEVALEAANDKAKSATRDNVERRMQFNFSEIVNVTAKEDRRHGASDIFKTDTDISQSNGSTTTRALQPFDFDEDSSKVGHLDSDSMGWSVDDMFQVNKEKFDVNSTYDEEMVQYTTKLERQDTDNFRQREARAQRIAQEIESKEKSRFGVDDTGTEEEMFSSVVRQEVAPPPPKTTPFHPNGGVPSISNNKNELVAPPTSATVEVNSIPKTDSGSTGSRDSKTELLLDAPTTTEATPTSLADTPTLSPTSESSLGKDADSSDVEKVTEVKQKHLGEGESGIVSSEEKPSPVEPQAAADGDQSSLGQKAEEPSIVSVDKTSESVRKFKLDPNAKEFTPAGFSSLPATPIASPSPALSSSSSSARSSASTLYLGGKKPSYRQGGRQMRSQHQHMSGVSTVFQPGEVTTFIPSPPSVGQGSYVLQTPSFIRPAGLHTQPTSGQVFYTPVHQFPTPAGLIPSQPGMMPPQQLVAASPKFVTEIPAQPQVIGQPYPQTSQATHQFIPPLSQAALLQPSVSQTQIVQTPQGLVSAHQPVFNVVQGTLATGAGAAGAGGLVGGVPFHQYHHHQALAAAASTGQPGVGVATQPLAGAAVTPNRQLFQQSHQVGK